MADLAYFKSHLLTEKTSIMNKTLEFRTESLSSNADSSDEAEVASRDLSMSLSIHLHERDRHSLLQIDRALGKISDGTFGQCESCESLIDIRRLKARPLASLCLDCMEEIEDPRLFPQ